jgi:hypothetical protein
VLQKRQKAKGQSQREEEGREEAMKRLPKRALPDLAKAVGKVRASMARNTAAAKAKAGEPDKDLDDEDLEDDEPALAPGKRQSGDDSRLTRNRVGARLRPGYSVKFEGHGDGSETFPLASVKGTTDLRKWTEGLPEDKHPALKALMRDGKVKGTHRLAADLAHAIENHTPDKASVHHTAADLLERVGSGHKRERASIEADDAGGLPPTYVGQQESTVDDDDNDDLVSYPEP